MKVQITLVFNDLTTKLAIVEVRKLPKVIHWKGNYFAQTDASQFCYVQTTGEDLTNIETPGWQILPHREDYK